MYLRVRPTKKVSRGLVLNEDSNNVEVHVAKRHSKDYVNNQREDYTFKFDTILNMQARQEQVFDSVAKDIVDNVLKGYNGTLFAYGQTGSGKTYTITGGAERYVDRGLIPRSISYIFSETRKRADCRFNISISYLEIYNEDGFDLLEENQSTRNLHDLPHVHMREDGSGNTQLSNLSVHRADSEEDALNLLFIGDTNRVVAETPKHDASTRSHCIFIIQIETQKLGSDVKTVSKLCLVDLAGSERVGKTGVDGLLLKEARYINVSLHFLEQVIVCLQRKSQGEQLFVPYRNSFMTRVLRDSLGGNCMTAMIATISAEEGDLDESVCTCRFAQRVACIKNEASKNEQLDPSLIIQRLKQEVAELKAEVKLLKGGGEDKSHLTPEESEECRQMVEGFVQNRDPAARLILSDMLRINECFFHFKKLYLSGKPAPASGAGSKPVDQTTSEEVERLRLLVQQRDNEIAILLNHLNKQKDQARSSPQRSQVTEETKITDSPVRRSVEIRQRAAERAVAEQVSTTTVTVEELQDRNKAFDIFRRSYRKNEAMEENKQLLKSKIFQAKSLTETINHSRSRIEACKNEIEQLRKASALQGLVDGNNMPVELPEEAALSEQLEHHKQVYRRGVSELRDLKSEIEGIQKLLENSRKRMQADFENWLQLMMEQNNKPKDPSVEENLQAFYRARDDIYRSVK